MIIERLDLKAYGRFTDVSIDLSAGPHRFHLVYGPNESGKSTSLRAITALLFGMPHQTEDAYLHPAAKIRVGGYLRGDDGSTIEVLRRRGRQKTLRQPNDTDVIDDSVLQQMIGGVDLETFKQQYGLSHDELVQGGAAIISGGGDLGAILFAAGAGIGRLKEVQSKLDSRSDQLFKRSGKNATLNQAIREFDEKNKKLRELQVPPSEFQRLQDELKQKSDAVAESELSISEMTTELTRLRAYRQALPLAPKWKLLSAELLSFCDVPLLDEGFTQRRREYESQHALKSQSLVNLNQQRAEVIGVLESLSRDTPVMTYANEINQHYQNLGAVQKARKDRVGLARIRHEIDRSMVDALRELAIDIPEQDSECRHQAVDDSVSRLQLTDATRATINSLAQSFGGLVQQRDQSEQVVETLRRRLDDVEVELQELGAPSDPETLRRVMESVGSPDARLEALSQQADDVCHLERKCNELCQRLAGFEGTAKRAASLTLPATGLIDQVTKRLDDADDALSTAKAKLEQLALEKDVLTQRLRHEEMSESLPTVQELEQARKKRNELIDDLAHAASVGDVSIKSVNKLRGEVLYADQLIDKIFAYGEAVHRRASEQAKLDVINDQILQQQSVVEAALEESSDASEQWHSLWQMIDVGADSPKRMQRWVADHEQLVQCVSQWETENTRLLKLEDQVADSVKRLREAIAATRSVATASVASATPNDSLSGGLFDREASKDDLVALYEEAATLQRSLSETTTRYKQLREKRAALRDELPAAEAHAQSSREKLKQWDDKWDKATAAFVDPTTDRSPEVVVSLLSKIDALCEQRKERNILVTRIRSIGEDDVAYRQEVVRIARLLEIDPDALTRDGDDVSALVQELFSRLQQERTRSEHRASLADRLSDMDQQIADVRQQVDELNILLSRLCKEAGCVDIDSLVEVERQAQRRRDLRASLESVQDQLRILAGGDDLESFVRSTLDQDAGVLDAAIEKLENQHRELNEQREMNLQAVGALRRDLERIDGSDEAAALRQSIQFLAGHIASQTQQYAQTKIASLILREAIEDYRQHNQGPVLGYAKDFFSALTCGEYETLRVDHNEKGTPVLVGVRVGDRSIVRAEDMSTGTADALYLSLRLASLRHQLTHGQTLPLIVDDCLVQLDDARATAALRVLSQLSTQTQVILFTHHEHLLDLADRQLAKNEFHVHSLIDHTAVTATDSVDVGP